MHYDLEVVMLKNALLNNSHHLNIVKPIVLLLNLIALPRYVVKLQELFENIQLIFAHLLLFSKNFQFDYIAEQISVSIENKSNDRQINVFMLNVYIVK